MSEVALSIGGRSYKVACAQGEEAHVARLGEAIDAKLQSMAQLSSQDTQNLLFAALLLADEIHDGRNVVTAAKGEAERLASLAGEAEASGQALDMLRGEVAEIRAAEKELRAGLERAAAAEKDLRGEVERLGRERDALQGRLDEAQHAPPSASPLADPGLAPALERFAELLENCADKLEGKPGAS